MAPLKLSCVYPILSHYGRTRREFLALVSSIAELGLGLVQLREKTLSDPELFSTAQAVRDICHDKGVRLVINDRVDVAQACGADGVHLGQADLPIASARQILGPTAIIGLSTHNFRQFQTAQKLAIDYVALGPIFRTHSKKRTAPVLGVQHLLPLASESRLPIVAIGGITAQRASQLWQAGAVSVAVISDILARQRPVEQIQKYLELASTNSALR